MARAGTIDVSFNLVEELYVAMFTSRDGSLIETYLRNPDMSIEMTLIQPVGARSGVRLEHIMHSPVRELFEGRDLAAVIRDYPQYEIRIKPICFV